MKLIGGATHKKILWVHNFPNEVGAGGVWMHNQHYFLKDEVDLYFVHDSRNPLSIIRHIFRLRKLSERYEIAHAQYGSIIGFITSLMKCKRVLSLKGSDWYTSPSKSVFHRIRIIFGGMLTAFSLKRFDSIIVMSETMKKQVLIKFPNASVETIVDPIDLDKFQPIEEPRTDDMKKVLFASVNLNNPIKRFDLAKKSFDLLHRKMPNTQLVTMSKIPHTEVNAFMNSVDVLLLTSTYEGWPNVVKEILACNKPFVSTRVSDLELLASKTISCYTCDDSAEALSEALFKALNSKKENLRVFVKDFSMEESLAALNKIYEQYSKAYV